MQVTVDGVAWKAGLLSGDVIRQIGGASTHRMTHDQAKMEIIRAGNELDFFVHRSSRTAAVGLAPVAAAIAGPDSDQIGPDAAAVASLRLS